MFTFRPPPDLEAQLEYLSQATGHTKNTIASLALAQYLKTADLSKMPLSKPVMESDFDRHIRETEAQREQYKLAHQIAHWSSTNQIWSAKPGKSHGEPSPAIYGRNVVVGFTDSFKPDGKTCDRELYVISRNLASVGMGTDSYHLYVTKYQDWDDYMVEVKPKR
ncbi:ribbon-helix-helix domain-containing protein [Burkholderia sp. AU31624]|uniref:ribbon-helix-helix domain-containing protein n=1 Tax=Burkholderia sp. AU31624 TaxID=2879629 RepID=UPI001CF2E2BB|nr:ribbon-helix-helix domain-containing protein [Burkholderia sp. AU31624]MCA8258276.1 ribbon-helix-helix domain-containing protein [Burkholderia sp. AU31624]